MGELFNRNVHPLYSVMAFVAALIVFILYLYGHINHRDEEKKNYIYLFALVIFYCVQDGVWGLLASGIINSDLGLMIASAVFHLSSACAPFVWTLHFCQSLRGCLRHPRFWLIPSAVLSVIQLCLIVVNFFNHFMFYVDDSGNYQTTDARAFLFYLQFSVYILLSMRFIVGTLRAKTDSERTSYETFLWISLAPVFFGVFQLLYPDAPANSIGFCIGCILIQTFLTQAVETHVHELESETELKTIQQNEILSASVIRTLSLEYGPLYLANLKTGTLQVFRHSDMERAILVQALAIEIPEYDSFIRIYAERHVVEEDREAFLAWTERSRLDSVISTENISEFNYKRNMNGVFNYYQFCCGRVSGNKSENLMIFGFRNVDAAVQKELKTKRALEQALKDANIASEAKTRFLFNMSHDIRTPMNAVLGFTDLAKKHLGEPERAIEYLDKAAGAGTHLLNLINEILDMSRIESGKMVLREAPMNLTAASAATVAICTEAGRARGVTVELHRGQAGSLWVYGDELRLNQIATNIISNAVKYTNPGGRVDIWVNILNLVPDEKVSLELVVKDTGIGMSEEFVQKIYEPFERSASSTVSGIQGTGLGMSIVKQLIEMMNGKIDVASELGVGTTVTSTFTFRLASPVGEEKPTEARFETNGVEGMRILLAEDNEMNREIACEILSEKGVLVETVNDGDVAVERICNAKDGEFDLILMDVQMPRLNGYEATKQIRALENKALASIPIVAMTANAFEEDRQNAFAAGMNDHLAKPIDLEALDKILATYCGK